MQMPSPVTSAQTRRFERLPSSAMSKAVSRAANDSATISVPLSGVTAMPFGNARPSATSRAVAVGRDQRDLARRLAAREDLAEVREVEVERVDVDVAAPVDGQLAPAVRRDVPQVGVADPRAIGLDADQLGAGDEHAARRAAS